MKRHEITSEEDLEQFERECEEENTPKEKPGLYFTSLTRELIKKGKLSWIEAATLSLITKINTSSKEPFFGTNKWLAGELCVTKLRVSKIISQLVKLGLVKQIGFRKTRSGRQRLLISALSPRNTFLMRKGRTVLIDELLDEGVCAKTPTGCRRKRLQDVGENAYHSIVYRDNKESDEVVFCENDTNKGISSMPFLNKNNSPRSKLDKTNPQITKFDIACAKQLKKLCIKEGWIKSHLWNPSKQAKYIAQLRKKVGKDNVQKVIDWYCSDAGRSIKLKLKNCLQLKQRWDDWSLLENTTKQNSLVLNEDTKRLVEKILTKEWPAASQEITKVVVESYNNIKHLNDRIESFLFHHISEADFKEARETYKQDAVDYAHRRKNNRGITQAAAIWSRAYLDPVSFILDWFTEWWSTYCYIIVERQQKWKGGVKCMVFDPNSVRFQCYLSETSRFQSWDIMMKGIEKYEANRS